MSIDNSEELRLLKNRADTLGISYHPNIGISKLRDKVNSKLSDVPNEQSEEIDKVVVSNTNPMTIIKPKETRQQRNTRLRNQAKKLVRVRITCMNPSKSTWKGEIISAGNSAVGSFKRFIPFNADEGWHIETILLNYLKERKFQTFYTTNGSKGQEIKHSKLAPEFSIEILPYLNHKELCELSIKQAMANGAVA